MLATEVSNRGSLGLLAVIRLGAGHERRLVVPSPNGTTGLHLLWEGLRQRTGNGEVREPTAQEHAVADEMVTVFNRGFDTNHPAPAQPLPDAVWGRDDQLRQGARDRLLALPYLTETRVRELVTPGAANGIALRSLVDARVVLAVPIEGRRHYPVFQFTAHGLNPVAVHVNLLLLGSHRASAVARWWTTTDEVLQMRPVDALEHRSLARTLLDRAAAMASTGNPRHTDHQQHIEDHHRQNPDGDHDQASPP
ncbi:hypothetical protein E8D34_10675 [Nocardioides sp. GY 10113]|uniref:hypothetical protein n=1 Tax=Nocardioides sp. GY 10113 TaxID=2569761 RepID=UPI0010A886F2|nr:hypothetical protein [Nocardioides sp. GY 10113]TIC86707.1 hypothetical protein E8D34_10675 [Nocardioides sp. GY 10113]